MTARGKGPMARGSEKEKRRKHEELLKGYEYPLPESRIALRPSRPRDAAKLLVYRRSDHSAAIDRFRNLDKHLSKDSVLVINDTKVIPARLITKLGRDKVELFYVGRAPRGILRFMANRPLEKGTVLRLASARFRILGREDRWYRVKPSFPAKRIYAVLERLGRTPLPPYLEGSPLTEKRRREEYQAVFASEKGSVAAPTASLHFTARLLDKLEKKGIKIVHVTLHVNLGTFAPLGVEHVTAGKLHSEEYEIAAAAARELNAAKRAKRPIVAVGTTVCRALESAASSSGRIRAGKGETRLFIREPYRFRFADSLITNFHVPRSSLMMLVAALVGREKLLELYALALKKKMRFLSFGDGMAIL